MKSTPLRIGTRDSKLALWQAQRVQTLLQEKNFNAEIISVKSEGDLDLVTPLYAMGVQGVFTKTLDAYLLSNKIDIAVHSFKDAPTQMAKGIAAAAVLKRGNSKDIFVYKNKTIYEKYFCSNAEEQRLLEGLVATGSVRRKAQLLHRFPKLKIENLRGNVITRLKKFNENNWDGAIFAAAGLERINELPPYFSEIEWMLPSPAQGAIMMACRENDKETLDIVSLLNNAHAALCAKIERDFLKTLLGGCSTPIGAFAEIKDDKLIFKGNILSLDGKEKMEIEKETVLSNADELGVLAANELLQNGADNLVKAIKNNYS